MYNINGNILYEGEWKNGKYHGKGTMYNNNGSILYEGEWENGMRLN